MKYLLSLFITLFLFINIGCNNINKVKNTVYDDFDNSVTIGKVLETYKYFDEVTWKEFKSNKEKSIIEVKCKIKNELIKENGKSILNFHYMTKDIGKKTTIFLQSAFFYNCVSNAYLEIQFTIPINKKEKPNITYIGYKYTTEKTTKVEDNDIEILEFLSEIINNDDYLKYEIIDNNIIFSRYCNNPETILNQIYNDEKINVVLCKDADIF